MQGRGSGGSEDEDDDGFGVEVADNVKNSHRTSRNANMATRRKGVMKR